MAADKIYTTKEISNLISCGAVDLHAVRCAVLSASNLPITENYSAAKHQIKTISSYEITNIPPPRPNIRDIGTNINSTIITNKIVPIKEQIKYYLGILTSTFSFATASITPIHSVSTGEVEYYTSIVGSRGRGLYTVRIPRIYRPDITASIYGLYSFDLSGEIFGQLFRTFDIRATIAGWVRDAEANLPAILYPFHTSDITADTYGIPGEDLPASLQPIPYVPLIGILTSVPYVSLRASAGGHFPEDIYASMTITQPVDLPAFIRQANSGTSDLGGSITQQGYFSNLPAGIRSFVQSSKDLPASLIVRQTPDIYASIRGWVESDITASLITQREKSIIGIINGWVREAHLDLPAVIRRTDPGTFDLPVYPLWAVISTHTSDKPPNIHKPMHTFPNNKYLLGSRTKGLYLLTLEQVYGIFPDLHASINVLELSRKDLGAYLKTFIRETADLPVETIGVSPYININKLAISLVPSLSITASIFTRSGFNPIKAIINPSHSSSTGTSPTAGYSTVAVSFNFYLGTNKGLIIPPREFPSLRVEVYQNDHPRPDLNAYVKGFHITELTASLRVYPYTSILASIMALDTSHISSITASLIPARLSDLLASILPSGGYKDLPASISVRGGYKDLPAIVIPTIDVLSRTIIPVSIKPFADLYATINFDLNIVCGFSSSISEIGAFIRPYAKASAADLIDLKASIDASNSSSSMTAGIVGRKRSRIRLLNLSFRSMTRTSSAIFGILVPLVSSYSDLSASIKGILHEVDLAASINVIRLKRHQITISNKETVVDLNTANRVKEVLISFQSGVGYYVYEDIANAIYETDYGTWGLNLKTLLRDNNFYDKSSLNKVIEMTDLSGFNTLDEAIRFAVVLLTEGNKFDLSASITGIGGVASIRASLSVLSADRNSSINANIFPVVNMPDIMAAINTGNGGSGYLAISAATTPLHPGNNDLVSTIVGNISEDLQASINFP